MPPGPLAAQFSAGSGVLVLTFDSALMPAMLARSNWFLRIYDQAYLILSAEAAMDSVILTGIPGMVDPGANIVSYSPPPFDVLSWQGEAAEAFSDLPVEVVEG